MRGTRDTVSQDEWVDESEETVKKNPSSKKETKKAETWCENLCNKISINITRDSFTVFTVHQKAGLNTRSIVLFYKDCSISTMFA